MDGMDVFLAHSFDHHDRAIGQQKKNTVQLHKNI